MSADTRDSGRLIRAELKVDDITLKIAAKALF